MMPRGQVTTPVSADPAFESFYRERLEPLEARVAARRDAVSETRRRLIASVAVVVVAGVLFCVAAFPGLQNLWFFALVGWIMVAVVLGAWSWWPIWGHSSQQKDAVVSAMASFYGDLEFLPHPNLDLNRYRRWGVLPDFDARWARDQIRGSHRRVPFSATEITLLRRGRTSSEPRSGSVPIFEGLFVEMRLPEKVGSKTVFGTEGGFTGIFATGISGLESFGKWSADFEVFGSDLKEAERLVTAEMLRELERVARELGARRLVGGFHRDRLLLIVDRERAQLEPTPSAREAPKDSREAQGPDGALKGEVLQFFTALQTFRRDLEPGAALDLRSHAEVVRQHLAGLLGILERLPLEPVLESGETVVRRTEEDDDESEPVRAPGRLEGWGCFFAVTVWATVLVAAAWVARSRFSGAAIPGVAVAVSVLAIPIGLTVFRLMRSASSSR